MLVANLDILRARPELQRPELYLAAVECDGEVVGAAAVLPPNPLVISPLTPTEALPALVAHLAGDAARVEQITDTTGPAATVEPFVALWQERTGRVGRVSMRERLHRIDAPPPVPAIPGHFRLAEPDDLDLVVEWSLAFNAEAWRGAMRADPTLLRAASQSRIEGRGGSVGLWIDGAQPVAMASVFGLPPGVARLAPVYTPPALRRHGYGTAVTAALTRLVFERGHACCMLFTDVSNPTSNHIYTQIGYRPVLDWVHASIAAS